MFSGEGKERSRVASKAKCRETTTNFGKSDSRDCHRYHSLSVWSELALAFSLSERSCSENRTRSASVITTIL